jgi:hypothetical protein
VQAGVYRSVLLVQAGVLAAYGSLKSEVEEITLAEESLTRQTLLTFTSYAIFALLPYTELCHSARK